MIKKVPVLFLVFNRLEETKVSFSKIVEYQPSELFLACDGPRNHVKGEFDIVNEIREYLLSKINWPCKIFTKFNNTNEGCKLSVSNSITWFFENVEYGVIIEDDCIVDLTFFDFCLQNLEHYKFNNDVWHIDGSNYTSSLLESNQFHFSKYFLIWGWATWRRAWKYYSLDMIEFDSFILNKKINNTFRSRIERKYWIQQLTNAYNNKIDTWDYQWFYTIWNNNGLSIRPNVNLVKNIGFSKSATHTKKSNKLFNSIKIGKIIFPLDFSSFISQNIEFDEKCSILRFNIVPFYKKILNKIK